MWITTTSLIADSADKEVTYFCLLAVYIISKAHATKICPARNRKYLILCNYNIVKHRDFSEKYVSPLIF